VLEGNYLLLNEPGWEALQSLWDFTIFLETDLATIEQRLLDRWLSHGYTHDAANAKISLNDLPNAKRILSHLVPTDLMIKTDCA